MASNAENVSIWLRHHVLVLPIAGAADFLPDNITEATPRSGLPKYTALPFTMKKFNAWLKQVKVRLCLDCGNTTCPLPSRPLLGIFLLIPQVTPVYPEDGERHSICNGIAHGQIKWPKWPKLWRYPSKSSDNGLSTIWCRAIVQTNSDSLTVGPQRTIFGEIWIGIQRPLSRKGIWECYRQNVGHFVQNSMCLQMR